MIDLGLDAGAVEAHDDRKRVGGTGVVDDKDEQLAELQPPVAYNLVKSHGITVLCAEPGMGKSYLVSRLVRQFESEGHVANFYDYEGVPTDVACRRIVRSRIMRARKDSEDEPTLVVFDGVPAGDEAVVDRESQSLRRFAASGAQVVVCIRPEAEQLIEALPEATSLRMEDLLYHSHTGMSDVIDLTGGIPSLVVALRADQAPDATGSLGYGPRFGASLEELVRKTLREGLTHEELRVRLAMLLLGNGTMDEVKMVSGRCDAEQLSWLERNVPLLGVDARDRRFRCHGLDRDELLDGCTQALHAVAADEPALIVRACSALAARDDVRRSAIVSRLCSSERDHAHVCVTWGVAYAGVGEARLVSDALRYAKMTDMDIGVRGTLSAAAVAAVAGTSRQMDAAWESLSTLELSGSIEERLYRRVHMLGICRDTLRNPRQMPPYVTAEPHDAVGLASLDHMRMARLLASGRFDEAYATMANEMLVREPQSLPEALLCDDLLLALSLSGGVCDSAERALFAKAEAFFAHPGARRLQSYHAAIAGLPSILMSSNANARQMEDAILSAERAGDSFMQGLLLAVCAVADVRAHAFSRAHVRAERAARLLRALGEEYLASSAEFVDALARCMLNEKGCMSAYCKVEGRPGGLALLGRVISCAEEGVRDARLSHAIPLGTPCPRDCLWALNLLEGACEGVLGNMSELLPTEWVELMRTVKYRQARGAVPGASVAAVSGRPSLMRGGEGELGRGSQTEMRLLEPVEGRFRISVLGGFGVRRDGQALAEGAFERRRARDLIEVLAVVPGHRMRRAQAIEILWPNDEYYRGPRRLYEAASEARKRLMGKELHDNPIIADKSQGSIGLDTTLVSCDVDDFERVARSVALEDGDDFTVLEHARQMDRLYAGGLDARLVALGGPVEERAQALLTLYVDALIAAGEAALRLGKAKLAVRYGMDAHGQLALREDAAILVVKALRAAGRSFEIADFYRHYSRNLVEQEGVPPSMTLRRTVDLALSDGPDLLPA